MNNVHNYLNVKSVQSKFKSDTDLKFDLLFMVGDRFIIINGRNDHP